MLVPIMAEQGVEVLVPRDRIEELVYGHNTELEVVYRELLPDFGFDKECFEASIKNYLAYFKFPQEPSLDTIKTTYTKSIRTTIKRIKDLGYKEKVSNTLLYTFLYSWFVKESEKHYGKGHSLEDYVSLEELLPLYTELAGDIDKLNPDKEGVSEKEVANFNFTIFLNKIHEFCHFKEEKLGDGCNKQGFVRALKQKTS